jgi:hypothetical protein
MTEEWAILAAQDFTSTIFICITKIKCHENWARVSAEIVFITKTNKTVALVDVLWTTWRT